MKIRINLADTNDDHYPGDYVLVMDHLTHNQWGHSDGQALVLKPNGCIEFGHIGGDTDVYPYSHWHPLVIWDSLLAFMTDDEVNDVRPDMQEAFIRYASVTKLP